MDEFIIDSCVAAKWVLPEVDSDKAVELLQEYLNAARQPQLLDLTNLEVGNAIATRLRRRLITQVEAEASWQKYDEIPRRLFTAYKLASRAVELSFRYRIATYDAAFVAAVERESCNGITSDVKLYNSIKSDYPQIILLPDWHPPRPAP